MTGELNCPYCLWPMKPDEAVESCGHCSARYHAECWVENGGCGTFGCPAWAAGQSGTAPPAAPSASAGAAGTTAAAPVVITADAPATDAPPDAPPARQFCDMCGQRVEAGDQFCGSCGTTL